MPYLVVINFKEINMLNKLDSKNAGAKTKSQSTVGYRIMFMKKSQQRPNKKMPISAHIDCGELLQIVQDSARYRTGVCSRITSVRSILEDWMGCEYPNWSEVTERSFTGIYYHYPHEFNKFKTRTISELERHENLERLARVKEILSKHYPSCKPLNILLNKIDKACESLISWTVH